MGLGNSCTHLSSCARPGLIENVSHTPRRHHAYAGKDAQASRVCNGPPELSTRDSACLATSRLKFETADRTASEGWGMVPCFVTVPSWVSHRKTVLSPASQTARQPSPLRPPASRRLPARLGSRPRSSAACSIVVDVSSTDDLAERSATLVSADRLRTDATGLVSAAVKGENAELSVLLCSDAFIADLNAQWRSVEKPTDVLSFPQGGGEVRLLRALASIVSDPWSQKSSACAH